MMNQEQIQGKFKQLKGKAKQQWSRLTDEDFQEGSVDRLVGRITELYGITKAEAQKAMDDLMGNLEGGITGKVHKISDDLSGYVEQGQKKLEDVAHNIKEQSQEWYESIDKCMKEKPIASLAVALGVGALLGLLLSR
ncbi:MAG: hypothetical protein LEGION0398_MBIBDBAK_01022 [Legionellaceae bacterium]